MAAAELPHWAVSAQHLKAHSAVLDRERFRRPMLCRLRGLGCCLHGRRTEGQQSHGLSGLSVSIFSHKPRRDFHNSFRVQIQYGFAQEPGGQHQGPCSLPGLEVLMQLELSYGSGCICQPHTLTRSVFGFGSIRHNFQAVGSNLDPGDCSQKVQTKPCTAQQRWISTAMSTFQLQQFCHHQQSSNSHDSPTLLTVSLATRLLRECST